MLIKPSSLALILLLAASTTSLQVSAQQRGQEAPAINSTPRLDVSKRAAEWPMKSIIGNKGANFPRLADSPRAKNDNFNLAKPQNVSPAKSVDSSKPSVKPQPTDEKVEPGKVRWHKAVQTAMDASRQSGKPVLLFQMMGRLDDRFC